MMTRNKGMVQPVGAALETLVQQLGIDKKLKEYEAVLQWEAVVGNQIARVTRAERITQGILVVSVAASAWRQELTLRKKEIIGKLNSALATDIVKDIRFR